ncbi:MAG: hypothetical protein U0235_30930 [Polyangiaceae bacterium]
MKLMSVIGLLVPVAFLACTSTKPTESGPSVDGGPADGSTDAPTFPIDASLHDGAFGAWYTPAAIPSGSCSTAQPAIEFNVNPCCNDPDTPELARYRCECSQGSWACKVLFSGAGYCRDASAENNWNAWTPSCERDGG